MKRAAKVLVFLSFGFVFVLVVGFLAFYHLVQVGEFRAFMASEIERQTDFKVHLGDGELEMGRILGVGFRDVAFTEPDGNEPAITANRITARVALLPLLRRRVVISEIRLQGPTLRLSRAADGRFPLLDRLSNLPFLKQHEGQFGFDLRAIKVSAGEVHFEDHFSETKPSTTLLHELSLDLERLRGQAVRDFLRKLVRRKTPAGSAALEFVLATTLERDGQRAKVNVSGTGIFPTEDFEFAKAHWIAQTRITDAAAGLLPTFFGDRFGTGPLDGNLDGRFEVDGESEQSWQISGDVKFTGLTLAAPEAYAQSLNFGKGQIVVALEWRPLEWTFPRLEFTSPDLKFKARGAVRASPKTQTQIQLSAVAPALSVDALKKYLPRKWLASAKLDKFLVALSGGEINVKNIGVAATVDDLRQWSWESLADRLRLDTELRNVGGDFSDGYLPFRNVQGQLTFQKGVFSATNLTGRYGQTRFDDLDASYRPASGMLDVHARGVLDLAEAREQMKIVTATSQTGFLQPLKDLGGAATFNVAMKRAGNAPMDFAGKLGLEGVRVHVDRYALTDLNGEVTFDNDEVKIDKTRAVLNASPVQMRLAARNYAAENGVFDLVLESDGVKTGVISTLLSEKASMSDPGTVRGWTRYRGPITSGSGRTLSGYLNLANVQFPLQPLLQPLRELSGTIKFDQAGIDFQDIKGLMLGVPASVTGRWRFAQKTPLLFDFAAPELDLQYLLSQIDVEATDFYANLEAVGKVSLGHGRYRSFEFNSFKSDIVLDHRVWKFSRMLINAAGGGTLQGTATINHRPDLIEVSGEPRMEGVPMRNMISWFEGSKTDMTGRVNLTGRLESFGRDGTERLRNLSGVFNLRIEDGTIHRLRVLVQILNFLDLSRWFTLQVPDLSKRGINFRSITADFKADRGVYTTDNLVVDSDDLRMTGAGQIDSPKDEIDFVVAVRPFAGMDTGLNQIPLIGTGIAAIKNSFLVASVNIKGSMETPTITPAPLSTLSEVVLGVLRIPKSILTLPSGERKENVVVPPAQ